MSKIKSFFDFGLDFLFPSNETAERIKFMPAADLATLLPKNENDIEDTRSLFTYKDEQVKHLVWEIKYHKNEKIADSVGMLMAQEIKKYVASLDENHPRLGLKNWRSPRFETFLIVPIPQTGKRFRERGFHHTRLLAQAVVKNLPANFVIADDILEKTRNTPKQSSIENREERFANVSGAFSIRKEAIPRVSNANIIIVDDVITTSATTKEAMLVMSEAGAKNIHAFAIAH